MSEQAHPIADLLHLAQQVRGEQNRDPFPAEVLDQIQQQLRGMRIEAGSRLVQNDDLRVLEEQLGKPQPLG